METIGTQKQWRDLLPGTAIKDLMSVLQNCRNGRAILSVEDLVTSCLILFEGAGQNNKNMAAELSAAYTGKQLFRIDTTSLQTKFTAETEKNIATVFEKAEGKNWLLFFDEADALFGKRTHVNDAHDRYANQEASYLLSCIDKYSGLVIMGMRNKNNISKTVQSRFRLMVHFPHTDND